MEGRSSIRDPLPLCPLNLHYSLCHERIIDAR
jgi:hypothetical protein